MADRLQEDPEVWDYQEEDQDSLASGTVDDGTGGHPRFENEETDDQDAPEGKKFEADDQWADGDPDPSEIDGSPTEGHEMQEENARRPNPCRLVMNATKDNISREDGEEDSRPTSFKTPLMTKHTLANAERNKDRASSMKRQYVGKRQPERIPSPGVETSSSRPTSSSQRTSPRQCRVTSVKRRDTNLYKRQTPLSEEMNITD